MALDFPSTPTIGQIYGGYFWDGEKWVKVPDEVDGSSVYAGDYMTIASVQGSLVPSTQYHLRTSGYSSPGDGGGALYKRVGSMPAHFGRIQSGDGAWWELAEIDPDVRMFGAKFDNVTDDAGPWNFAIEWANLKGGNVSIRATGGISYVASGIAPIVVNNVWIVGDYAAGIRCGSANVTLQFSTPAAPVDGGGVVGLDFKYTGTPPVTQTCINVPYGFRLNFTSIALDNIATFIVLGIDSTHYTSLIDIQDVSGYVANVAAPFIMFNSQAGLLLSRIDIALNAHPGVANRIFLQMTGGSIDTLQMDFIVVQKFYIGIMAQAGSGVVLQNMTFNNCFFDDISGYGILLVVSHPNGIIVNMRFDLCWFTGGLPGVSPGIRNVFLTNQGTPANGRIEDITFVNSHFHAALNENIYISGNTRRVEFASCRATAANAAATGSSAVYIEADAQDIQFRGGYYNHDVTHFGYTARGQYAFNIAANADRYNISDVEASGTIKAFNVGVNSAGSKRRRISGGGNPDYTGPVTGGIFVLPASGGRFTNTTPFKLEVYFWSGTLILIKNGATVTDTIPFHVHLDPGEYYDLSYTTPPALTYHIAR